MLDAGIVQFAHGVGQAGEAVVEDVVVGQCDGADVRVEQAVR